MPNTILPSRTDHLSVIIKNVGDTPFVDSYDGRRYSIEPGSQLGVPYDAMCLWLGHPKANNFDPRNRVRVQEFERLRMRYGVDAVALDHTHKGTPVTDPDALFDSMRPHLEVTDFDGNPIVTVADDPEGVSLSPLDEADAGGNQMTLLQSQIAVQARQMDELKNQLAQMQRTQHALDDAVPTPEDTAPLTGDTQGQVASIQGTITNDDGTVAEDETTAPRPKPRTTVGEDEPQRTRVRSS